MVHILPLHCLHPLPAVNSLPGECSPLHRLKGKEQREGMGLLEYQVMPSLPDIAHDEWLCTFMCTITI
jgi:hypothetical protein